ncbi:MAG: hypothetical protein HYR85_14480 [Planctomycetes bacterium]|nr:hypothetical protein [Planctomycetota bacterium]MBI3845552.1 hypothetical protein [Planctomycetota bacterium]
MIRRLTVVAIAVVACAAGMLIARPSFVRAGQTGGLPGRTHNIVKQHNLKHLTGTGSGVIPFSFNLSERLRNGSLAPTTYVVPTDRVFVVTDLRIESLGQTTNFVGDFGIGTGQRWSIDSQRENNDHPSIIRERFEGGLVFDPNSPIGFTMTAPLGFGQLAIDVIGYETSNL